jgi:hypothetical protein
MSSEFVRSHQEAYRLEIKEKEKVAKAKALELEQEEKARREFWVKPYAFHVCSVCGDDLVFGENWSETNRVQRKNVCIRCTQAIDRARKVKV